MQKTRKTLNNTPHHITKANQQWFPQQQEGTPNVFGFLKPPVHLPCSLKLGSVIVFVLKYCLTSPYGHLSITDSSFTARNAKNHTIPYLYNADTSVKQTLGSVPLVSILKRFDCIERLTVEAPTDYTLIFLCKQR